MRAILFFAVLIFSRSAYAEKLTWKPKAGDLALSVPVQGKILVAKESGELSLWDAKSLKAKVVTSDTRASLGWALQPKNNLLAFAETNSEDMSQVLKVFDLGSEKEVFRSTSFRLFLFAAWLDECRVIAATTETSPLKFYQFKVNDKCAEPAPGTPKFNNNFVFAFSYANPPNRLVNAQLSLSELKGDYGLLFMKAVLPNQDLLTVSDRGGLYIFSRATGELVHSVAKGYKPKVHSKYEKVIYEIPDDGFYLWDLKSNRHQKIATKGRVVDFWGDDKILVQELLSLRVEDLPRSVSK